MLVYPTGHAAWQLNPRRQHSLPLECAQARHVTTAEQAVRSHVSTTRHSTRCQLLPARFPHCQNPAVSVPQMLQTELDVANQQLEAQTAEYDEVQRLCHTSICVTACCSILTLRAMGWGAVAADQVPRGGTYFFVHARRSLMPRSSCMRTAGSSNSSWRRSCRCGGMDGTGTLPRGTHCQAVLQQSK